MDLECMLASLQAFFRQESQPYAVIGGLGLQALGLTRATFDLDLVVAAEVQDRLVGFLEGLGYETLHRSAGYSNHLHRDTAQGRLDFIYVDAETGGRLFTGSRELPIVGAISAPVPRPEHLAAMKVLAMKNDPSRTFQEMADLLFLLRLPDVDREEVRTQFERHGLSGRYRELLDAL